MSIKAKEVVKNEGFSLIELMVTIVIAMVVLGGLLLSFSQQNSEYKYQNKRIDAVQDLELGIKFIAEDLRSSLIGVGGAPAISITDAAGTDPSTSELKFTVWDSLTTTVGADRRALRRYTYDGVGILKYDRHDGVGSALAPMLSNVTFFKIFDDGDAATYPRGNFSGIPAALQNRSVNRPDTGAISVPGFTVLIEIAVDAGYKQGSFNDVLGNDVGVTGKKRIWRYVQVHPMTAVN